jgi:hypothetical protein
VPEEKQPSRSIDDLVCILGGCAALVWAGFEVSLVRGLIVLGACLIGMPVVFSWLLPMVRMLLTPKSK